MNVFSSADLVRVLDACKYAAECHGSQKRRSGAPYIVHPFTIASSLAELGQCTTVIVAAILHDVLEDTDATSMSIERKFGLGVVELVVELTNDPVELERMGKTDYLCKKVATISADALTIKLADRLDNISDITIENMQEPKKAEYLQGTVLLLDSVRSRPPLTKAHKSLIWQLEQTLVTLGFVAYQAK